MAEIYQIDNLDRGILNALMDNARTPYAELAKTCRQPRHHSCAGREDETGRDHHRRAHRRQPQTAGLRCVLLYRHHIKERQGLPFGAEKLESLEEVVEAYYTTGHYSVFIKVMCRSIDALQQVLINKIQTIDEIQSTETLISLQNPIMRTIVP